jgi:16S rRNA (guanine966-N2)-methyltransferase
MKHRTREAIFNLISTECEGCHAFDLFAGTGVLGLEALSRGAATATLIEKHVPTARLVEENVRLLGVEDRVTLRITSAFLWAKRDLGEDHPPPMNRPWLVFCSPPYAFYRERPADMLNLIQRVQLRAPPGSILIVEAEDPFNRDSLPSLDTAAATGRWEFRVYAPAVIGIWRKGTGAVIPPPG